MLTSSGQSATLMAVTNICEEGDHVICAAKVYGGTSNLLTVTLKRFGIDVTLVDQDADREILEKNSVRIQRRCLRRAYPIRQELYLILINSYRWLMSTASR